jgi:hypothetical protein
VRSLHESPRPICRVLALAVPTAPRQVLLCCDIYPLQIAC